MRNADPARVAVIAPPVGDEPPLVRWHHLSAYATHPVPDVPDLTWVGAHATAVSQRTRTGLRRQDIRLQRLLAPGGRSSHNGGDQWPVGGFVRDGDGRRLTFGDVNLGTGGGHHVIVRGPTDQVDLTQLTGVRIVVGCCLFGASGARFRGPAGIRVCPTVTGLPAEFVVRDVEVNHELGLYEWETVLRVVTLLRDLLAWLPREIPVTVIVDVPRVQYYPYLLAGYAAGNVPHRLLVRWWNEVDRRQDQVVTLLRTRVRAAAKTAGRSDVRIESSPGLDVVARSVGDAISNGWPARHGDEPVARLTQNLIRELKVARDGPQWQTLLTHSHSWPATLTDLALASYTWQLARPNLLPDRASGRVATLMVDDLSEHRLYTTAQRLSAAVAQTRGLGVTGQHPLIGIFPLRKLFAAGAPGTHSLYRAVHASSFRTESGQEFTAADLAAEVTAPPIPMSRPGHAYLRPANDTVRSATDRAAPRISASTSSIRGN